MLSEATIKTVKSTAPILQEHGETLTRHFYKRMFTHNPEVAPFFNPANQAAGSQQRALAGAICAYAANIDNLGALGSAVELIAQKHASLMIKPEQYPIVGSNLLASIKEVLGDGATDEVINAWGEAYGVLADILIGREKQIYAESAEKSGGWEGFRRFIVERKEPESPIITSFYLKPEDGEPLPEYRPGQYITIRMPTENSSTMRNYSLSEMPGQGYFRISVKRELAPVADAPDGFVSGKLHDDVQTGDVLEVGPPCGEFLLNPDAAGKPLVLLGAGIGVTPVLAMLRTALQTMPERKIVFIHACLNENVQAFRAVLDELAAEHPQLTVHHRYSDEGTAGQGDHCSSGFVDSGLIKSLAGTRDAEFYFCGPSGFMVNIYRLLRAWDVPETQVHFEFFGPRQAIEAAA